MPAPDLAPVPPTASVDAELLALATEFQTVDARLRVLGAPDAPDGVWESAGHDVHDRWWEIVNRVIDLPAHTQAGWAAKASIIPGVFRDVGDEDTADHTLALSLVRDMTGQADPGPDAELIRLCDRLVEIDAEERAILASTDEDDGGPLKPRFDALNVEWRAIDERMCDVADPVTRAGALAVARVAVAQAPKQTDGSFSATELAEWLAFTAAKWFAREGVA
jgi:hypothetical protein